MATFEEDLARLEELSSEIKQSDISLETALKDFEEGIKLARKMEKQLDSIESKIQILMKEGSVDDEKPAKKTKASEGKTEPGFPELGLFAENTEVNGTRNS